MHARFALFAAVATLALLQSPAPASGADKPDRLQQTYYIEHATDVLIRNGDGGEILNIAALNDEYETRKLSRTAPRMRSREMHEMLRAGGEERQKLNDIARSLKNYSPSGQAGETLKDLAGLAGSLGGPRGKSFQQATEKFLSLYDRSGRAVFGPQAQRQAQTSIADGNRFFQEQGKNELRLAFQHAQEDPEFRKAFNNYFSRILGIETDTSSDKILDANGGLRNRTLNEEQVRRLKELDKKLAGLKAEDIQKQGQLQEATSEVSKKTDELLKDIEELKKEGAQERERVAAQKEIEKKQKELKAEIDDARALSSIYSTYLGLIDPQVGQVFSVASDSALQVYESISRFGLGEISEIVLTGNIVGAVFNIISLFGGGQPSAYEQLSKQIHQLSEQISHLHTVMNRRFDRIDESLNTIYKTMLKGFQQIEQNLQSIDQRIGTVLEDLNVVRNMLDRMEEGIDKKFRALSDEVKTENMDYCLRYRNRSLKDEIPFNDFVKCQSKFHTWSTQWSTDPIHVGTRHDGLSKRGGLHDASIMHSVAKDFENPFDHLQTLSDLALLLDGTPLGSSKVLPELSTWYAGAEAYLQLLGQWRPAFTGRFSPQDDLDRMIDTGKALQNAISDATFIGKGPRSDLFDALFAYYELQSKRMRIAIHEVEKEFFEKRGLSPNVTYQSLYEEPQFYFEAPRLGKVKCFGDKPIEVSEHLLEKWVPGFYLYAQHLGLGTLSLKCSVEIETPESEPVTYLRMEVRMTPTEAGKKLPFLMGEPHYVVSFYLLLDDLPQVQAPYGREQIKAVSDWVAENWETAAIEHHFIWEGELGNKITAPLKDYLWWQSYWWNVSLMSLEEYLSPLRREFTNHLLNAVLESNQQDARVRDAAGLLTAASRMINAFVQVGFPDAYLSDPELRNNLTGTNKLENGSTYIRAIARMLTTKAARVGSALDDCQKDRKRRLSDFPIASYNELAKNYHNPAYMQKQDENTKGRMSLITGSCITRLYPSFPGVAVLPDGYPNYANEVISKLLKKQTSGNSLELLDRMITRLQLAKEAWATK